MTEIIEEWRTAVYDGIIYEGLYKVSNLGKTLSLNYKNTGKPGLMTPFELPNGYFQVNLSKNGVYKHCYVHRLIAETFLENPENLPEVNHKDEDKTNNFVFLNEDGSVDKEKSNLEWKNHRDNCNHGTRNERIGVANKIANTNGKLSKTVLQFTLDGEFVREWPSVGECARNGFNKGAVAACCRGERKTHKGFRFIYTEDFKEELGYIPLF